MDLANRIFAIKSISDFNRACLEVFALQASRCAVYADYLSLLGVAPEVVQSVAAIPFLPIEFFKHHRVYSADRDAEVVFSSSGTTGSVQSKHYVADAAIYRQSFRTAFEQFYGQPHDRAVLALLPSYSEREGSSLIYMVDDLIRQSDHPQSGYFLYDHGALRDALLELKARDVPTLLIGVTYALLDFVETHGVDFPGLTVMETGGMKGRRREMIREEVHERLRKGFNVEQIHSEYGMTELLSQAYAARDGRFLPPPWMKILIRDTNDPFSGLGIGKTGAVNVIDLANIHSCAFIATQDLGKMHDDGTFEVLGRFDQSDIRGCNLLIQ